MMKSIQSGVLLVTVALVWGDPCNISPGEPVGFVEDAQLDEMSGLAMSQRNPGLLWTFNDHGGDAVVYGISTTGEKLVSLELQGVKNSDWEDIATVFLNERSYIYVSDTGNNDHDKEKLSIYRFEEPQVDTSKESNISIEREEIEELAVTYPGYSYDCEALTVDQQTGDIFLFTKDREANNSEIFRYPAPQSFLENPFTLEHVGRFDGYWITGGDISPNGKVLGLTNKQYGYAWEKPDELSWYEFLSLEPTPCILHLEDEEQRESLAVTDEGYWSTSECKACPIWFYARL